MIRNYITIAYRNLVRNKVYSLINIFGLAIGMAACFFIFQYVHFESGYDSFNKKLDRLYRIPISYSGSFSNVPITASNHPAVGPAMKKDFPGVQDFVRVVNISLFTNASTLSYQSANEAPKIFNEGNIFIVDGSFFNLFSYPLISGDPQKCLSEANTIVISQTLAKKYFGSNDPLSKTLTLNSELPLKVTGVLRDVPENSHLKFDALISFNTLGKEFGYTEWKFPEFYNYILLAPGADPKKLEAKFPAFVEKYLGEIMKEFKFSCAFHLQPVSDIHLRSNYHKEAEANGSEKEVSLLSVIGVFILVIACINYVNLSTAKSMERAKEVGLRKVVGAPRRQLIVQFLFESLLINILALLIAAVLILACLPFIHQIIGKDITSGFFTTGLGSRFNFWAIVAGIFLAGSLLVGAYPALVLSSFKPVKVLKGLIIKSTSGISLRRVLVSFQFVLSIILIAATIIIYRQLGFMRNGDLGYQKEQLLIIKAPVYKDSTFFDKFSYFKTQLRKNPAVLNVSSSSDIPGNSILSRNSVRKAGQEQSLKFTSYFLEIDENFISTYKIKMVSGTNFQTTDSSGLLPHNNTKVLINEVAAEELGFKSSEEAVAQDIIVRLGTEDIYCKVAGVIKNFHQRSLKEKYDPILCYYPSRAYWKYVSVKLNTSDLTNSISKIEKEYKSSFTGNPFEYFFLDDYFNRQYQSDQRLSSVFGLFALLAIIIACLGLLGLSSFIIKVRIKEIGIRKVLGASVSSILVLFSKDFIRLVIIASVIAVPVIYFAAQKWLTNYAFHINLSWFIFVVPPFLLLIISLITTSFQSLRAALSNPVKSIRSE
jgi:putative ABC transport system permease protein